MRGKRDVGRVKLAAARITPADAGKTALRLQCHFLGWDHPRGCGENTLRPRPDKHRPGSPPRMRGKPPFANAGKYTIGITPADAGKTQLSRHLEHSREDHPRGCGENGKNCESSREF